MSIRLFILGLAISLFTSAVANNKKSNGKVITHVTLTSYNPVKSQCWGDPTITANGTKINLKKLKRKQIKYCAVSRDLLWLFPLGSKVHIEGHGEYLVVDTMNVRFNHCMDILQHVSEKNFKKEKVKVTKLR